MGRFIHRASRHECDLPRDRLFKPLKTGDVWECSCGKQYRWTPMIRTQYGTSFRWKLLREHERYE